jgi:hypothetical protein
VAKKKKLSEKLAKKSFLRGRKANRLAVVLAGPLAPVVKTVRDAAIGKKDSLAYGKIKVPKQAIKVMAKIPVVKNMPGAKSGVLSIKNVASISAILPAKAIKAELKNVKIAKKSKSKKEKATETAAMAVVTGAEAVAEEQGVNPSQIIEQPQNDQQVQETAKEVLAEEKLDIQEQLEDNRQEQAIRRAELEQMTQADPGEPVVEGARSREEIIEDQTEAAYEVLAKKYPDAGAPFEEAEEVSEEISSEWVREQQEELEAAQVEEEILEDAEEEAEEAEELMETEGEEGFQGLMGLIRGK